MKHLKIKLNNRWHDIPFYTNDECPDTTAKTLIEDIKWSNSMKKDKLTKIKTRYFLYGFIVAMTFVNIVLRIKENLLTP